MMQAPPTDCPGCGCPETKKERSPAGGRVAESSSLRAGSIQDHMPCGRRRETTRTNDEQQGGVSTPTVAVINQEGRSNFGTQAGINVNAE